MHGQLVREIGEAKLQAALHLPHPLSVMAMKAKWKLMYGQDIRNDVALESWPTEPFDLLIKIITGDYKEHITNKTPTKQAPQSYNKYAMMNAIPHEDKVRILSQVVNGQLNLDGMFSFVIVTRNTLILRDAIINWFNLSSWLKVEQKFPSCAEQDFINTWAKSLTAAVNYKILSSNSKANFCWS